MDCSHCGKRIDEATLRCPACHFDMLPVDIAQQPLPHSDGKMGLIGDFFEATRYPRPTPGSKAGEPIGHFHDRIAAPNPTVSVSDRIRANDWLLWMIVLVVGTLVFLSLRG